MPLITILGTVINFPDSGSAPQWSQAVIQFATLVSQAINSVIGSFDVPPQSLTIDGNNPGTNVSIPNLTFSTLSVRAAFIRYSVYRNTSLSTAVEQGTILIAYNPTNPSGNLWEINQDKIGNAHITFSVTDTGEVEFSTTAISGTSHNGVIFYTAQSMLQ